MTHEPRASPISKLHDDILWSIFQLNSHIVDVVDYRIATRDIEFVMRDLQHEPTLSLITNRRTSQVCRRWRILILNSPGVWANAVDLQYLNQQGDEWRNEVLKRTGIAPLTIAGQVGQAELSYNLHTIPFILELLTTHWNRVRTLILYSRTAIVDEALRFVAGRPAPILENLVIDFSDQSSRGIVVPFQNYAPRLHTLSAHHFSFNLSQPLWSSNIRLLNLAWSKQDMSITELLLGLESMISLETLYFRYLSPEQKWSMDPDEPNHRVPTITFSSLKRLVIGTSISMVPELIAHIILPSQCSVEITTCFDDFDDEIPDRIASCCTTFLQNNFPPCDVIDLDYSLDHVDIADSGGLDDSDYSPEATDYLLMLSLTRSSKAGNEGPHFFYSANMIGLGDIPFCMAEALSAHNLSNITTFTLTLNLRYYSDILHHPLFDDLYDFLLALNSVEVLHTNDKTLRFYMDSEVFNANVLFPRLVTIFTDKWDTGIHQFLKYRHENSAESSEGLPKAIKRLVFEETSTTLIGFPPALSAASKLGVTVGWKGKLKKVSISDDGVVEFAP